MKGTYLVVVLSPGTHKVTIAIESGVPDSVTSISLNSAADRRYFVSFRDSWASIPEPVMTLHSEQEAMSVRTGMTPAR